MDWNRIVTILIIAFIILNVFLFSSSFNEIFSVKYDAVSDLEFVENVENMLRKKNININGDLPKDSFLLPMLDTEYEIILVSKSLLERFLGPGIEPIDNVNKYSNEIGEILEVKDGKKLCYTLRELIPGNIDQSKMSEKINEFVKEKGIEVEGYSENYRYESKDGTLIIFTKKYNDFSMDNSYMNFYFDNEGIYKFEMQNIITVKEIAERVRTFSVIEALPSLLSYGLEDKEIIGVEMTYYSVEDDNWQYVFRINSYPVWKIIFSDGTIKHISTITLSV